jgi:hypothetical protein
MARHEINVAMLRHIPSRRARPKPKQERIKDAIEAKKQNLKVVSRISAKPGSRASVAEFAKETKRRYMLDAMRNVARPSVAPTMALTLLHLFKAVVLIAVPSY